MIFWTSYKNIVVLILSNPCQQFHGPGTHRGTQIIKIRLFVQRLLYNNYLNSGPQNLQNVLFAQASRLEKKFKARKN